LSKALETSEVDPREMYQSHTVTYTKHASNQSLIKTKLTVASFKKKICYRGPEYNVLKPLTQLD